MTKRKEEESIPLILYPLVIVLTILFIVFTLLTFGIFLPDEKETKGSLKQLKRVRKKSVCGFRLNENKTA